jgi:vitamin B12 transporter
MKCALQAASLAAAINLTLCAASHASEERARDAQVVVTATRVEQPLSEVIGSVSVITRDDIQRRAVHSIQDLLRGETGVSVVNLGGLGKLSNVFLRGADAEQVLVLIDGVRVGSATSGTTPFEFVPIDQIERIEIIRGPRSSLYGSDAIGGVIQIFTRRGDSLSVNVGAGSDETTDASASFGISSANAWVNASGNRIESEGYNSCAGAPFPPGGGCFTTEPDRDGYKNNSGTLRTGYRWKGGEIEGSALFATGSAEYDGDFANLTEFTERVISLRGRIDAADRWSLTMLAGNSLDEQDYFYDNPNTADNEILMSEFDSERHHVSLQSDYLFANGHALTLGADYLEDRVESSTAFDEDSRDNLGVFAQYQAQVGAHRLLASARHDDNQQFGTHETGNLGWKWAFNERWSLMAAWGSAFGAPTFNDLYYPGFSNPNLKPETSDTFEIGIGWTPSPIAVSLSAFETHIDELIVYDASLFAPNNLNRARIRGIEADVDATLGTWVVGLGYSALDPRNRTAGSQFGNFLPRRARHSGHMEVGRSFGPIDGRVRFTAEGSRYDDAANSYRLGSYGIIDIVLDYAIAPAWTVQGKIANALDREYRTVRWYNQDDRTFFVNIRYQP